MSAHCWSICWILHVIRELVTLACYNYFLGHYIKIIKRKRELYKSLILPMDPKNGYILGTQEFISPFQYTFRLGFQSPATTENIYVSKKFMFQLKSITMYVFANTIHRIMIKFSYLRNKVLVVLILSIHLYCKFVILT